MQRFMMLAVLVVGAALLGSCISASAECDALPDEIELTLSATTLTPSDVAVCRGDEITLVVRPEVDGVFHVHGYDEELPATNVTAGEAVELVFTATQSGQFPIELHTDEHTQGVDVGLLTVNEP